MLLTFSFLKYTTDIISKKTKQQNEIVTLITKSPTSYDNKCITYHIHGKGIYKQKQE